MTTEEKAQELKAQASYMLASKQLAKSLAKWRDSEDIVYSLAMQGALEQIICHMLEMVCCKTSIMVMLGHSMARAAETYAENQEEAGEE